MKLSSRQRVQVVPHLALGHKLTLAQRALIAAIGQCSADLGAEVRRTCERNLFLELERSSEHDGTSAAPDGSDPTGDAPPQAAPAETDRAPAHDPEDFIDRSWGVPAEDDDEDDRVSQCEPRITLREHLLEQHGCSHLAGRRAELVRFLIEELSDDGYFPVPLDTLVDVLPSELEVTVDELEIALENLQKLDPPGVGARHLGECLFLQLRELDRKTPYLDLATRIVTGNLALLADRDFTAIGCSAAELKAAHRLITTLNPRPGNAFSQEDARYVVPDVLVKKVTGKWVCRINPDALPRVRINQAYAQNAANRRDLAGMLKDALWVIKMLQQRCETILRIATAIIDAQPDFPALGEAGLRPLNQATIARKVGVADSTVSRGTTEKYIQTPRGIYELKRFFVADMGGASPRSVRLQIAQLVENEDPHHPLTDNQLVERLAAAGITIARRTVASTARR